MTFQEREFTALGAQLSGKLWGSDGGQPVLALHGWMDNAGSFDMLAPLLDQYQILAIDSIGHGRSEHFPDGHVYNIWSDVAHMFEVADQLGWKQFSIIGHSRGANVAAIMAGTFPDRVSSVVLLDGGQPETVSCEKLPEILAKSVLDKQKTDRQPTYISSREDAITLRKNGHWEMSRAAINMLAERGLSEKNGDFYWHTDQKLKDTSELRLTPDILTAFYERITAPVHAILAESGLAKHYKNSLMADKIPHYSETILAGTHHNHMTAQATTIAETINTFFAGINENI